ncbi:MAG: metallophosphoesterase [Woeseiaceae bacterium]|nr:metallophosphoesterase [Woeseiaceae bacterium]
MDIVGDVHGEFEVMQALLHQLGYDAHDQSNSGRTLVFLGDLVDRGPDSPAVVDKVIELVRRGQALCLMGNHELNLIIGQHLPGNGWFIQPNSAEKPGEFDSRQVAPEKIDEYLAFFESLPVVLENESLRLVHACWHPPSIAALERDAYRDLSIRELYRRYENDLQKKLHDAELAHMVEQEDRFYGVALRDPEWSAEILPAHAEAEVISQMNNPFRVLTSGSAHIATEPSFAAGKWRMTDRTKWWQDYDDDVPVVIGHFWRRFDTASERISGVFGKDVFEGIPSHAWMGKRKNVYCVDYSVGQRHVERRRDPETLEFHGKLAALRYPEWEVHHDDGTVVPVA